MKKIKFNGIDIVIIILFLLSVYFILTRIFGQSATDITISITLFGLFGTVVFKIAHILYNLNREFGEFKVKTINAFERLKEDIKDIKKDIIAIKSKIKI